MTILPFRSLPFAVLSVASLAMWFALGFPWNHHNESLVWAVELQKTTFVQTLLSNPITPLQSYRPLGVALVWLTFHATGGGIWLQQLVNFFVTAAAWVFALFTVRERALFAGLSFLCAAGYFSGYIYLFHLHGVFYGPLFFYLAWLLRIERNAPVLDARTVVTLVAAGVLAASFHTFAFLLCVAFLVGLWIQNRLESKQPNTWVVIVALAAMGAVIRLLTASSKDLGSANPIQGILVSYRALEVNAIVAALSAALVLCTVLTWSTSRRIRLLYCAVAAALVTILWFAHVPVIIAWVVICGLKALALRRWALAALLGVCALLPGITAIGSPTYALFVLMPCIAATAIGSQLPSTGDLWPRVAVAVAAAAFVLCAVLKVGVHVPGVSATAEKILAEQEKTQQLQAAFAWLDQRGDLSGNLQLCEPGDFPIRSKNAIERQYRAPTNTWPLDVFIKARYGERLRQAEPKLWLCFGGEALPGGDVLYTIPGRWAGPASIEVLKASLAAHASG